MFVSAFDLTGEISVDKLVGNGEFILRAPIGYDDVEGTVYSAFVALSPLIGYADLPGYELIFNITASSEGCDVVAFWDGSETVALLAERSLREKVRVLIFMLIEMLIDEASPALVSMTTHRPGLPIKALAKYHGICAVFRSRGFRAGKADEFHGQHIWMMERPGT
ncbi:hypothetical protein ASG29_00440 [Sphingomonas sp. Leaf412]|uniref:hypothetical protein n=1 Tax=Sphingomonas sp. Leaf412 TaxID=1736370 RepID=UPI0006FA479F|nr:hypothetical protein [Sphingomonas sp. Leaf412]KQT34673.1 hypothetical protein ASG29_00440 [Sphingomonas sp. Leaf412]